jgi:hypothetical protein
VLREAPVSLASVCPEAPVAAVQWSSGTRRGIPVLAIRNRHSGDPESWAELGIIGVLRCPLLPETH